MKNIAFASAWKESLSGDKLFDLRCDRLGQNGRVPWVRLKEAAEQRGYTIHTIDMYEKLSDIDFFVFQDIWKRNIWENLTKSKLKSYLKQALYKNDDLLRTSLISKKKKLLIILEPPAVFPFEYKQFYHKKFDAILTWDDDLVDNKKYFKIFNPQPVSNYRDRKSFSERAFLTMICSDKKSDVPGELYSERRRVIDYFEENHNIPFDLYGYGWEKHGFKNYKGTLSEKLLALSNYKFSICFENMTNIKGYITEKIFDCFFAGSIPVYWGADNISDYIPEDCYIDFRKFKSLEELIKYLESIDRGGYEKYIDNICRYLGSKRFLDEFSVEAYVNRILSFIDARL